MGYSNQHVYSCPFPQHRPHISQYGDSLLLRKLPDEISGREEFPYYLFSRRASREYSLFANVPSLFRSYRRFGSRFCRGWGVDGIKAEADGFYLPDTGSHPPLGSRHWWFHNTFLFSGCSLAGAPRWFGIGSVGGLPIQGKTALILLDE